MQRHRCQNVEGEEKPGPGAEQDTAIAAMGVEWFEGAGIPEIQVRRGPAAPWLLEGGFCLPTAQKTRSLQFRPAHRG